MAAPNMTVSSPGQVNGAGDAKALYLKVFAGEVLSAFTEKNIAMARTMVRSITSGKTAQFPASWKSSAAYHTPGDLIIGTVINGNERNISIDDLLVASCFMANYDEAMTHYDMRSEYSRQLGEALAKKNDQQLLQVLVLAARASATVTGGSGGTAITDANAKVNADSLISDLFEAAQALDEKDVPEGDRFCALKPDQYYLLVNSASKAIHRDYGGAGNIADGLIMRVAGLEIVKTNHLPSTNVNTGVAAYQGDFTNLAALVWHRSAAGTVKLVDVAVESDYMVQYQGTLVVAKQALGHGILRPESAVEIKTA